MNKFTDEVKEKLGYYVYRLIDPRNGNTFYVGKGKGNRVFAHVNDALRGYDEDGQSYLDKDELNDDYETSLKISTIRDIKNSGLSVIHVIHRWGLTEIEAFQVEAALIDCYGGLSNKINGRDFDHGVTSAEILQKTYSIKEYDEPPFKYMIIKIKSSTLEDNNNDYYSSARGSWRIDVRKAEKYKICLIVLNGIVKKVYSIERWKPDSTFDNNRFVFDGTEADENISALFIDKRIPEKYRKKGAASPVLYKN